jgi:hypothetical protein
MKQAFRQKKGVERLLKPVSLPTLPGVATALSVLGPALRRKAGEKPWIFIWNKENSYEIFTLQKLPQAFHIQAGVRQRL